MKTELQKLRDKFYMMNTMIDKTCEAILSDVEQLVISNWGVNQITAIKMMEEIKQLLTQKEKEE